MVTHDPETARHADRVIRVRDGLVVSDEATGTSPRVAAESKVKI